MKKLLSISVALVLCLAVFAGCGGSNGGSTPAPEAPASEAPASEAPASEAPPVGEATADEDVYIALISKGFQHQFWQAVHQGAMQAAGELGITVTFEGPESETQVDKQLEMLEAALAKKPQAIGFAALDSQAATPLLEKAEQAGIPVIGFDSGVDSPVVKTTCATDNKAASAEAAVQMARLIGEEGEVGIIVHDQTSKTGTDRRDGFVEKIEADYPNIKVVDIQYGDGDHLKSTELAKAMMTAYPNIKGMYGANEGSIAGVNNAVREMNKVGQVTVIGFDSGKDQLTAIKEGVEIGAITQDPVGMGYKTVMAAYKAYKGETNPEFIDTGFRYYTKDDLEKPEVAAVIYE